MNIERIRHVPPPRAPLVTLPFPILGDLSMPRCALHALSWGHQGVGMSA